MFIENKKSGKFLAKKSFGKKFLVKIDELGINEKNIRAITKKESDFIFNTDGYKKFEAEIYNKETLKDVVFKSKLLDNYIKVLNLLDDKGSNLYHNGYVYENWFKDNFPIEFIFNSNNIEGSKIPEEEVKKIIENKKYIYKIKNEIKEVENSIKVWDFINKKFIFNEANIKKVYHILTKDLLQSNGNKYPRGFKKVKNIVNNNITTDPENVSKEILLLIENYKKSKKDIFSLSLAFDFHLKYEQIHPFEDGNGRTGRFLMNKILLQNGMFPMIVFKENKLSYSNAISSCSAGNKKKYYKFMIEQYKKTLDKIC
ncbi:MAG: Fic family protein [Candidatus Gracilibacteria bacterium]